MSTSKTKSRIKKGHATERDHLIGRNLRHIRTLRGMTQQESAAGLGVTFQQLQKYETGRNRIAASRLYDMAALFDVPIDWFYQGYALTSKTPLHAETHTLIQSFTALKDPKSRQIIQEMTYLLAKMETVS